MADILYDELLKKIPNKYVLTIIAGKRSRDIIAGAEPLVEKREKDTVVKTVFREIIQEKIGE